MALRSGNPTQKTTSAARLFSFRLPAVASALLTCGGCFAMIWLSFYSIHPLAVMLIRFTAYVLAFNLLPGFLVARVMLPGVREPGVFVVFSLGLGVAVNLLVFVPLWAINRPSLICSMPVLTVAAGLVGKRRLALGDMWGEWRAGHTRTGWICGTIFICLAPLLSIANILGGDPADAFSMHFAFQGVILRGLENGWPPPNLLNPDVPLSYNYAAHLWLLGASRVSDLPIDLLVARYGPMFFGGSAAAMMLAFDRRYLGLPWWIAALAVTCVFWIVGVPPIAAGVFGTFMPFGATLVLSPFLSIMLFFVILAFVLEGFPARGVGRFVVLALLVFLATGARGTCPPIIISSLMLRTFVTTVIDRRWPRSEILDTLSALAGFGVGLRFFFTFGTGFSGTGFVHFTGQPFDYFADPTQYLLVVPHMLIDAGLSKQCAGTFAFLIIVFFQAGFLSPSVPLYLNRLRKNPETASILLVGGALAGAVAVFVTEAPGYSQFSFLYFKNIGSALLGARGFHTILWRDLWQGKRQLVTYFCLLGIILLAGLQLAQLPEPVLRWFCARLTRHWTDLLDGQRFPISPVAGCLSSADSDLFAVAKLEGSNTVVIDIPSSGSGHFYCESFWMVVRTPLQIVSNYALAFVPGSASGPLDSLLKERGRRMNAALTLAAGHSLSVSDVTGIADTLEQGRPTLVLAERDLVPDSKIGLQWMASNDHFTLWRVMSHGR